MGNAWRGRPAREKGRKMAKEKLREFNARRRRNAQALIPCTAAFGPCNCPKHYEPPPPKPRIPHVPEPRLVRPPSPQGHRDTKRRRASADNYRANIKKNKRDAIYERDGRACCYCGSTEELTIDHIIPVAWGGTNEDENLQTLCHDCNNAKGNRMPEVVE